MTATKLPELVDPTDTLAVLKAAREWLTDPAHWCRDDVWVDAAGAWTAARERVHATCVIGAYHLVASGPARNVYRALTDGHKAAYLTQVNEQGHAAALGLYDAAIKRLEATS